MLLAVEQQSNLQISTTMVTKMANSQQLEAVVRGIDEIYLNNQRFRRTGSSLRREVEPGFIHIIDFGLGQSWSMRHGQFGVTVSVFVAEAYELFYSLPSPRRPTAFHCELRRGLGMLATPPADRWWQLSGGTDLLVSEVGREIVRLALPFLSDISSRRAFVEAWFAFGNDAPGLKPRGILTVAAVLANLGDHDAVEETHSRALSESVGKPCEAFYAEAALKIRKSAGVSTKHPNS